MQNGGREGRKRKGGRQNEKEGETRQTNMFEMLFFNIFLKIFLLAYDSYSKGFVVTVPCIHILNTDLFHHLH
jgi:hypothetical protein